MAAYPSLPASPTLTNPDMILPYGEYDGAPSPEQHAFVGDEWGGGGGGGGGEVPFSIGPPHVLLGQMTPTTPIIYGNGTMLSDIGEVTEAESTPGRRLPGPAERRMLKQAQGTPFRSSPTVGYNSTKRTRKGAHARKYSMESNSTVTSEGRVAVEHFKDFDEGSIVDDSNFQGDDEESVASYSDEVFAMETQRLANQQSSNGQEEDRNSSAALSRRAEQILLNAKKRLNNMEGNLTRARSSLQITPSSSISSIHSSSPLSRSTPSPSDSDHRILPQLGLPASRHHQIRTPYGTQNGSPGHTRVYSENSIVPSRKTAFPVRASSAAARYMGREGSDSSQRSPPFHESSDSAVDLTRSAPSSDLSSSRTSPPRGLALEPLGEDEVAGFEGDKENFVSSADEWHPAAGGNHRLTRSASSMQMRDLRDQMQDLKGRLSVLRDRARDDSMKRRSLQSLRTPSPFTAAEQWYSGAKSYGDGGLSTDAGVPHPAWEEATSEREAPGADKIEASISAVEIVEYPKSEGTSIYEDVRESNDTSGDQAHDQRPVAEEDADPDPAMDALDEGSQDDSDYNDEIVEREELDDYESDASLYHDTVDVPISHEDREDAFDYEHFFLHSAMGTISQAGRRGSVGSFSSEDSVETTRGPPAASSPNAADRSSLIHRRSESTETVSTMATFATANEDAASHNGEVETQGDYAVQYVDAPPRSESPVTAKRSTFGSPAKNGIVANGRASPQRRSKSSSAVHDINRATNGSFLRPSVASFHSFDSGGTARSFPLVNKPRSQQESRAGAKSASILSDAIFSGGRDQSQPSPVNMLAREDQILVERLVASLGKCVLGLQEAGRASYEGRVWRRRLDAARRVLEGHEGAV